MTRGSAEGSRPRVADLREARGIRLDVPADTAHEHGALELPVLRECGVELVEHFHGLHEAADLFLWQIDLRDIAGHHDAGTFADSG